MYTEREQNLIVLSSFSELTYKQKFILTLGLNSDAPDFKNASAAIKKEDCGVYNKVEKKFYDAGYREKGLTELQAKGIKCVTYFSKNYPETLKNSPCPPLTLYCKGNTELLKTRCFAVVGSRRTQPNILKLTKRLCEELTQKFTVVTGMADGADSAALEGGLASGKIISVIANGFDYVYPAVNERLTRMVENKGLLITEYPPDVAPKNYNFPVRNRIIAGLSEAALIVSAGEKSGALITANYALEYGRTVFAFPYSLGVYSGAGCNALLKRGGILAENVNDIFSVFGWDYKPPGLPPLTDDEKILLEAIRERGEAFVPDLAEKLGKAAYQLIPALSGLEIKGLVTRLGGNRYAPC